MNEDAVEAKEWRGTVVADRYLPLADVRLFEKSRCVARARARRPFVLELEDGTRLDVDATRASLDGVAARRLSGMWQGDLEIRFGAFLLFPQPELRKVAADAFLLLVTKTVCAGDQVVVRGVPQLAASGAGAGFRDTSITVRGIVAEDVLLEDPVERRSGELTDEEQREYRVSDPPTLRGKNEPRSRGAGLQTRSHDRPRGPLSGVDRWTAFLVAVVAVMLLTNAAAAWMRARGMNNAFTRFVQHFGESGL